MIGVLMSNELMTENFDCCGGRPEPVPMQHVISKLDEYLGRNDYSHAESHLRFWLGEAELRNDRRGQLSLLNELMGLFRKTGQKDNAIDASDKALRLCGTLGLEGSTVHGTTLVNAATVYKAFGLASEALPLYIRAREVYESILTEYDGRRGGLYNNMALALVDLERYDEADQLYRSALGIMSHNRYGELEMAITYLNMANAAEARYGLIPAEQQINDCINRARELLDTPGIPHDGYYAFVCEKCAPTFGYYGYFLDEAEYRGRAEQIYSGGVGQ